MTDSRRIPKLLPLPAGQSLQSFPLAPIDGFVLSRIDDATTDADIIALTGMQEDVVRASFEKLVSLGIIRFEGSPVSAPLGAQTSEPKVPISSGPPIAVRMGSSNPNPPPYDPAELDEDADLELDHKRKVLDLFYRLIDLDYYLLLGVPRNADKKQIKRAYYDAAALFHPDRFFRKKLGSFKSKMEQVFTRMTLAHDTLTTKDGREEYDAYLRDRDQAADLEANLHDAAALPREPEIPTAVLPQPDAVTKSMPPNSAAPMSTPRIPVTEQARRDALARRLLGARSSPPPPPRISTSAMSAVPDPNVLRRHYETRVGAMRELLSRDHIETAKAAMAKGDPVAAANAYRLAVTISPTDPELVAAFADAQAKANEVLGENYRRQAQYEEKSGRWTEAARSWGRVVKSIPGDAEVHDRAANALVQAGGNLHEAATLARRAVTLAPSKMNYRATLVNVYIAAGLHLNARRELDAALLLAPDDLLLQALSKRVSKP